MKESLKSLIKLLEITAERKYSNSKLVKGILQGIAHARRMEKKQTKLIKSIDLLLITIESYHPEQDSSMGEVYEDVLKIKEMIV